jgi:DNA-binding XRE family transcriptional regulator
LTYSIIYNTITKTKQERDKMFVRIKRSVLEEMLIRKNVNKTAFAKDLNISPTYITKILDEKKQPSGKLRQKILDYFKVDFDDIFEIVK